MLLDIYIPGTGSRIAHIQRELHIIEELRAKILVGVDIIGPEGINIDVRKGLLWSTAAKEFRCHFLSLHDQISAFDDLNLRKKLRQFLHDR